MDAIAIPAQCAHRAYAIFTLMCANQIRNANTHPLQQQAAFAISHLANAKALATYTQIFVRHKAYALQVVIKTRVGVTAQHRVNAHLEFVSIKVGIRHVQVIHIA